MYKYLSPYYDLTCLFFETKYPTSNLLFPYVVIIYYNLKDECVFNDDSLKRMIIQMIGKFEKYWFNFNEMLWWLFYILTASWILWDGLIKDFMDVMMHKFTLMNFLRSYLIYLMNILYVHLLPRARPQILKCISMSNFKLNLGLNVNIFLRYE